MPEKIKVVPFDNIIGLSTILDSALEALGREGKYPSTADQVMKIMSLPQKNRRSLYAERRKQSVFEEDMSLPSARRPVTAFLEYALRIPETEKRNLNPRKDTWQSIYLDLVRMIADMGLNGMENQDAKLINPFYSSLCGRIPDIIGKHEFQKGEQVADEDTLLKELENPERELHGFDELNVLLNSEKFPYGKLLKTLSASAQALYSVQKDGEKRTPEQDAQTREQLLELCANGIQDCELLMKKTPEEMKLFGKVFRPHCRAGAIGSDFFGKRGIGPVMDTLRDMQTLLNHHVPFSHIHLFTKMLDHADLGISNIDEGFAGTQPGSAEYRKAIVQLKEQLLSADFTGLSPEEAAAKMNGIGQAVRDLKTAAQTFLRSLPAADTDPDAAKKLPKEEVRRLRNLATLRRTLENFSVVNKDYSDKYLDGLLNGNTRLQVPGDVSSKSGNEALNNARFEDDNFSLADVMRESDRANHPVSGKNPSSSRKYIEEKLEIISCLYMHLHKEGHSVGIDSTQYKMFRDSVKAVYQAWTPDQRGHRSLNLDTKEGMDMARNLLTTAGNYAYGYYAKHSERTISSAYGNVRKNAALSVIRNVDPTFMNQIKNRYNENGLKMSANEKVLRQRVSIDQLVKNEQVYSVVKYGNRNSAAYKNAADALLKQRQNRENRTAKAENREAQIFTTKEVVKTFCRLGLKK